MKKFLSLIFVIVACALGAQPTFTANPASACYIAGGPNFGTVTVSNNTSATSFSWSSVGTNCTDSLISASGYTAQFRYGCCGTHTITCVGYVGTTPNWTGTLTVNLNCPPNINISAGGGTIMCVGQTNTLVGTGAQSYTWFPTAMNSASIVISPSASVCYSLFGTDVNGCSNMATSCIIVSPPLSLSIQTVSPICLGQSTIIVASGAATYSWSTGATTHSIAVTPASTTCYTVTGYSSQGCTDQTSVCVSVNPLPSLSISAVSPICQGQAATLACWGATTYTWFPGSQLGASVTVMPTSTTIYTLFGSNGGCVNSSTVQVTVMPSPTLSVAGNSVVCKGSSSDLTVTGAQTYTWTHNSSNSNTVNVLPVTSNLYVVNGTAANGCVSGKSTMVLVDTTCAIVWPGDANSDGVVNSNDVLELGLYANSTGTSRNPGGNNFSGQYATAWIGNGSNNQNRAHVDCNGDGTVNSSDTLAIVNNFSQTHAFRVSGGSLGGEDLTLVPAGSSSNNAMGGWHTVNIVIGSAGNDVNDLYGVVFDLQYDASFVDQVHVSYPVSFLNSSGQNIPFRRVAPGAGIINCVTVRTDGINVDGNGKIGEFLFKHNGSKEGEMKFSATNVRKIDASGQSTTLSGGSGSVLFLTLGVDHMQRLANSFAIYPNPASGTVVFRAESQKNCGYKVTDIAGRIIAQGVFESEIQVDVSAFVAGTYFVNFETEGMKLVRKLVIE